MNGWPPGQPKNTSFEDIRCEIEVAPHNPEVVRSSRTPAT